MASTIHIGSVDIIDPNLDIEVKHLAIKDPPLYEALTRRKRISLDIPESELVVKALKTATTGQRVEIDGINGVSIYDAANNLNTRLNGVALVIRTAATGRRVEIDATHGIRVFDAAGNLETQFDGGLVELPDAVIKNQHLLDAAVSELKIAADAVTEAKIAVSAVTEGKIAALAVTAVKIQAGAVITDKLAADSVTSEKIVAGSVTTLKIAAGAVTANEIAAGTILAGNIASGAITTPKLAAGAVTAANIAAQTITANEIAVGSITADRLNVVTLSAITADLGTITAGSLSAVSITGSLIVGTTFKTATFGERVEIDSVNGFRSFDGTDTLRVQILNSTFAGIRVHGMQAISAADFGIFTNSGFPRILMQDGSTLFLNSTGTNAGGYFDSAGGAGGGNQPTDFVIYFQGTGGSRTARRVNVQQGTGPGSGYLYIS